MNDFHDLSDAFDELERRADAASAASSVLTTPRATRRARPLLIAASSVAVLAVAVTGAITASGDRTTTQQQAGGLGTSVASSAPVAPTPAATTSSSAPASQAIPDNPKALERLFTRALDGLATFTVTDTGAAIVSTVGSSTVPATPITAAPSTLTTPTPTLTTSGTSRPPSPQTPVKSTPAVQTSGAAIIGMLTSAGLTGGYDIQIYQDSPGTKAQCDDPGASSCSVRTLASGSSLATGSEPLQNGGLTYQATLVQADGTTILMHVSNDRDPKGAGGQSARRPPLSIEQMTAIVTSPIWPPR